YMRQMYVSIICLLCTVVGILHHLTCYFVPSCDLVVANPPSDRRLPAITFLRELFVMSKPFTFERRAKWYEPLFEEVPSAVPAMFGGLRNPRAEPRERQMR